MIPYILLKQYSLDNGLLKCVLFPVFIIYVAIPIILGQGRQTKIKRMCLYISNFVLLLEYVACVPLCMCICNM